MLRSSIVLSDDQIGVDRETSTINGYVVAELGRFKSEGRGQFTLESLQQIIALGNSSDRGVRSRFGHPNASNDGLGKFLGRARNFRLDESSSKVRADMQLNETALEEPPEGGRALGEYVMHLAETDPGAFSSSLVLEADREEIDGQPPVWMPTALYASDVVDTGDAVDDFLSEELLSSFPTGDVYEATRIIDEKFDGLPRDVVEARLMAFCNKYLDHKFGSGDEVNTAQETDDMSNSSDERIAQLEEQQAENGAQLAAVLKSVEALNTQILEDREERRQKEAAAARAERITALCGTCGVDAKQAAEWIADTSLSVEAVKDLLLERKFEQQKPAGGDDSNHDSADSALSAEFDEHAEDHQLLGVTKERFIAARKIELGKAVETEPPYMSAEWARQYCEKQKAK